MSMFCTSFQCTKIHSKHNNDRKSCKITSVSLFPLLTLLYIVHKQHLWIISLIHCDKSTAIQLRKQLNSIVLIWNRTQNPRRIRISTFHIEASCFMFYEWNSAQDWWRCVDSVSVLLDCTVYCCLLQWKLIKQFHLSDTTRSHARAMPIAHEQKFASIGMNSTWNASVYIYICMYKPHLQRTVRMRGRCLKY